MKHIRTVSRARVREAQGPAEILGLIGTILTILAGLLPLFGTK